MIENNRTVISKKIKDYLMKNEVKEITPLELYNQIMEQSEIVIQDEQTSTWALSECEKLMNDISKNKEFFEEIS